MLYYASVIGETPNGIISIDHNGIITNYNPSAGKYLGVSAAVACGQPASRLFPELDLESTFRQKTRVEDVVVLYRERQLHLRKILMKEDKGLEAAATALITDLSDFRKSEMSYLIKQRASLAKSGFVSKYRFSDIVGKCRPLTETISYAKIYAKTNYNVLIYGETGTGKELLAQSICNASDPLGAELRGRQLRRPAGQPAGKRAVRLQGGRLYRQRQGRAPGPFRAGQRRHHFSSTRSAASLPTCRSSCCGCCRSGRSCASATTRSSPWTCGSSPPPTSITRPCWRAASAGTCSSASTNWS
jgi:PAS domain S-box-containing protein